jgi:EPS-associated MarR family transcriptional regulator
MTPKISEDELKLLHLIEKNENVSQRYLASQLGISLGKINYCLSALTEIGYVKVKNFNNSNNKIKYIYILTPKGIRNKSIITKNFIIKKKLEYETFVSFLNNS